MAESSDVVAGTNAVADDYNKLRADVVLAKAVQGTETDGATVTIDWSSKTKGKVRTITLGGNRNFVFANATVGQWLYLRIIQGSGGSKVPTWDASMTIKWPSGVVPVLSSTEGAIDGLVFLCTASDVYDGLFAGFDLQ